MYRPSEPYVKANTGVVDPNDHSSAVPATSAEPGSQSFVLLITTRMPTRRSAGPDHTSASAPGSLVVTSTSKGAKSSATTRQMRSISASSSALQFAPGFPSRSYGSDVISACPVAAFHNVPPVVT